jgi:hypothetical protein
MNPDPPGDSDEGEFFFNPQEIFGDSFQVVDNLNSVIPGEFNNASEQFMDVDNADGEAEEDGEEQNGDATDG